MTRFYYDDPLAAAWMAKHFGMRFVEAYIKIFCNGALLMHASSHRDWEGAELTIHPDSLHLIKARAGDVCWEEGIADDPDCGLPFELVDPANHGPIIQRDGIPFHWPKSEEAK